MKIWGKFKIFAEIWGKFILWKYRGKVQYAAWMDALTISIISSVASCSYALDTPTQTHTQTDTGTHTHSLTGESCYITHNDFQQFLGLDLFYITAEPRSSDKAEPRLRTPLVEGSCG